MPFGKTKTLQNLEGGIVKKINVKQGDLVRSGDVIIELEKLASKSEVEELLTRIVFLKTEIISMASLSEGEIPNYPKEYKEKSVVDHLPRGPNTSIRDHSLTSLKIRKRIGLAGIIAKQPSLIVLDEPTAGLDPQTALIFYNFINRMIADQRTLIIATSDPVIIIGAGHNIVIDDQGHLKPVLKNTPSQLGKVSSKSLKRAICLYR